MIASGKQSCLGFHNINSDEEKLNVIGTKAAASSSHILMSFEVSWLT
jgi:hypothetical protein